MKWRAIPVLLAILAPLQAAAEYPRPPAPTPSDLCLAAVDAAERAFGIPAHLLAAIARVESGRRDPESGKVSPWPWTLNKDGQGNYYDIKEQAIAAAAAMRPSVARSLDVGCMQISLTQHPDAFANLEQAFDPLANATYGARFLLSLYEKTGSWPRAVAMYHSATPDIGSEYRNRVYAAWPEEQQVAVVSRPLVASTPGSLFMGGWAHMPVHTAMALPPPRSQRLGAGGAAFPAQGRTLDSYRAAPVRMAMRLF